MPYFTLVYTYGIPRSLKVTKSLYQHVIIFIHVTSYQFPLPLIQQAIIPGPDSYTYSFSRFLIFYKNDELHLSYFTPSASVLLLRHLLRSTSFHDCTIRMS